MQKGIRKLKANVDEIIDLIDKQSDEMLCFLDTKTGEPFFLDSEMYSAIEDEEDLDSFADWQVDEIQKAKEIFDSENYLELPEHFEINEYKIMEDFSGSVENKFFSKKMQDAIQGKGAFKRFKDALYQYKLWDEWNKFKENALRRLVIEWCNDNGLEIM